MLAQLSAQSCTYQSAMSRSASLQGISTRMDAVPVSARNAARPRPGDVVAELLRSASRAHVRRAREHRRGVDRDQRGGKDADGSEHAEPAADIRRNLERLDLLIARDGAQGTLLRIGDEDKPFTRSGFAEHFVEPRADDEILRHRLGRAARLRDHDEQAAAQVEPAEQRGDVGRVHVVEHVQSRLAAARRVVEQVPLRRPERPAQRDRSERRPADAKDDDVVNVPALPRPRARSRPSAGAARGGRKIEEAERSARVLKPRRPCAPRTARPRRATPRR